MVAKCHARLQATICICNYPNCNDWSTNGTVTTDVPVTDGSGVLCYKGTSQNYEATYCKRNETMCAFFGVDGGGELVISSFLYFVNLKIAAGLLRPVQAQFDI